MFAKINVPPSSILKKQIRRIRHTFHSWLCNTYNAIHNFLRSFFFFNFLLLFLCLLFFKFNFLLFHFFFFFVFHFFEFFCLLSFVFSPLWYLRRLANNKQTTNQIISMRRANNKATFVFFPFSLFFLFFTAHIFSWFLLFDFFFFWFFSPLWFFSFLNFFQLSKNNERFKKRYEQERIKRGVNDRKIIIPNEEPTRLNKALPALKVALW